MKSKKGFLLAEETLKIVIALISISFLIYFLTSLYMVSKNSKDLELAKYSLEHLISEIKSGATVVEIYNPPSKFFNKWFIVSWDSKDMPNSCSNMGWENCLCICKGDKTKDCDNKGICLESGLKIVDGNIEIKPIPLTLKINNGEISK